jgi:hypothetical protein
MEINIGRSALLLTYSPNFCPLEGKQGLFIPMVFKKDDLDRRRVSVALQGLSFIKIF